MTDRNSSLNYPRSSRGRERGRRYNTPAYYQSNRSMGDNERPDENERFEQTDNYAYTDYDDLNTGKYEDYSSGGYYGSDYGHVNPAGMGRDYEQNAGYRENYNRLPQGGYLESGSGDERAAGIHRGKGPRNYERSDDRIMDDIQDRLCQDPQLDATEIDVKIDKGEVILTGFVPDKQSKRRAEDVVETVHGIKQLENRLRTHVPGQRILDQKTD